MGIQPEHRSILAVDVEGFGRLNRTDPIRLGVHQRLRQLLTSALEQAGADPQHYRLADTGDGFLATISLDSREAGCARLLCCPGSDDTMKALVTDGSVTLRTADLN